MAIIQQGRLRSGMTSGWRKWTPTGLPWAKPLRDENRMRTPVESSLLAAAACTLGVLLSHGAHAQATPGCEGISARECVERAMDAMGGRRRLEGVHSVALDVIGQTALMEQSYRQSPFITAYQRDRIVIDLANGRLRDDSHSVWPESDPHQSESDASLIVVPAGSGYHDPKGDSPSGLASLDDARQTLALGPLRVLMTAADARDLHYDSAESVRSTSHTTVAFSWKGVPVQVLLNPHNPPARCGRDHPAVPRLLVLLGRYETARLLGQLEVRLGPGLSVERGRRTQWHAVEIQRSAGRAVQPGDRREPLRARSEKSRSRARRARAGRGRSRRTSLCSSRRA